MLQRLAVTAPLQELIVHTHPEAEAATDCRAAPAVLVVDDEPNTLAAAELTLLSYGIDGVKTAPDGESALELFAHNHIGAVLMDFTMPGLAGFDLLRALVEPRPDVPVVIVTAVDDIETAIQCMQIGASSYLVKPVKPEEYVREARKALEVYELRRRNATYERQAQRIEGLERLMTSIVADFNNLLQVVTSSCELAGRHAAEPEEARRHMLRATHAARSVAASASRLHTFAKGASRFRRTVDLSKQLARFYEFIAPIADTNIRVRLEPMLDSRFAKLCPDDLHQVLLNLALNAMDAMPHGGRLSFRCVPCEPEPHPGRITLIAGPPPESCVGIEVWDSGGGLDADLLASIQATFDPERPVSTEFPRHGLAAVHEILLANGGGLDVRTHPREGTRFTVRFREVR